MFMYLNSVQKFQSSKPFCQFNCHILVYLVDVFGIIRLNPDFAPAYDQLAGLFTMRHENLDEAHALNMHAIQLDPGSVAYRMNAVTVLMTMSRYADAASLLRSSLKVPGNPKEMAMLQSRLIEVESIEALGARPGAMITKRYPDSGFGGRRRSAAQASDRAA